MAGDSKRRDFDCGCRISEDGEEVGRGHIIMPPGRTCGLEAFRAAEKAARAVSSDAILLAFATAEETYQRERAATVAMVAAASTVEELFAATERLIIAGTGRERATAAVRARAAELLAASMRAVGGAS